MFRRPTSKFYHRAALGSQMVALETQEIILVWDRVRVPRSSALKLFTTGVRDRGRRSIGGIDLLLVYVYVSVAARVRQPPNKKAWLPLYSPGGLVTVYRERGREFESPRP